jgi:octaprenyl-diphosphate synthase
MDNYRIRRLMRKRDKTRSEIQQIVNFVQENNGIEESREQMMSFANRAIEQLKQLPVQEEQRRTDFIELIKFIITREK